MTWRDLVAEAVETLRASGVVDADMSARRIGWEATGTGPADWHEVAGTDATKRQLAAFDRMVGRRSGGEPLQYVLGSWGFRQLDLMVDRRVLIPRPETEIVAGAAIVELDRVAAERDGGSGLVAVDLGTGSGAIGLALASERPGTEVWLTDVSSDALDVARANLAGLGRVGGSVRLAEGHWFDALAPALAETLAVVVSNPPYVAAVDDLEAVVADWEPTGALVAPERGLAHLHRLVDESPVWLAPTGALVLEMDPGQIEGVRARAADRFAEVEVVDDLAGRPRALVARRPAD